MKDVSSDFEGKIIRLDVKHGKAADSEDTKGILIVRDSIYAINALGNRFDLLE